jgi:hypothetical protein
MGILSGNPENEPLHYGEVFAVWSTVSANNGLIATYQTFSNHVGDKDLRGFFDDFIRSMKQEKEQCEKILKINGIALPPAPPERPIADLENIPAGAKFNDPEMAASAAKSLAMGLVSCSQAMGQCVREDIAMMFGQFHMNNATLAGRLLRLNKEKGWLIPPPLHVQTPELAQV